MSKNIKDIQREKEIQAERRIEMSKDLDRQKKNHEKRDAGNVGLSGMLACPFCGKEAHILEERNGYKVICQTIDCVVIPPTRNNYFASEEQAIKAWNKRGAGNKK